MPVTTHLFSNCFLCFPKDSGRNGTHLPGHHSPGNSAHRGGRHLPLGLNEWRPELPPEGHLRGRVSAMGVSPAASQGQCHSANAPLRWDGHNMCVLDSTTCWSVISNGFLALLICGECSCAVLPSSKELSQNKCLKGTTRLTWENLW